MSNKLTNSQFIEKAKKIHNDKYDYHLSEYVNAKTKVKIVCINHGVFYQEPRHHLSGCGCPKCQKSGSNIKKTNKQFIEEARELHDNKYDYSSVDYINNKTKVKIMCSKHGAFEKIPIAHLKGGGCPDCSNKKKLNAKTFISKAKKVHGDKYDYSKVEYKNNKTNIKIMCSKHGAFEQRVDSHLFQNQGCPICRESKGESEIANYLRNKNLAFERQKKFKGCINKKPLSFDFYIPSINSVIEYNGVQHYRPLDFFGGDKGFKAITSNDKIKTKYCIDNGINHISIKYDKNVTKILNLFCKKICISVCINKYL